MSRTTNQLLINLSMLGPRPTGLGVYAQRCGHAAAQAFDAELIAAEGYGGPGRIALRSPAAIALGAGRWAGAKRWWWARGLRQPAGTLLYSPTHQGLASAAAQVLTIHDLTSVRHPSTHPAQSLYFRHVLPAQLKRCAAVFTVSQTTRQDLHEFYRLPLDSIHVVPSGVDGSVFKPSDLPRGNFLLVVGATFSHKNIDELIRFSALWRRDHSLVIVSSRGAYRQTLERAIGEAGLTGHVRFIDYARTDELVRLYQTCSAFVFPSKWEGFGIPPLEALACGAKVIASDIPVHREVLGDAASFVTLGDEASWAAALAGTGRADAPRGAAAAPVRKYTWEHSAQALVEALSAVAPSLRRAAAPAVRAVTPLPARAAA